MEPSGLVAARAIGQDGVVRIAAAILVALAACGLGHGALADEPLAPPPPPEPSPEPAPPIVPSAEAPRLPEGVTAIEDPRPVTFTLTGGNRVVARRVGEDSEFFWVETDGRLARIRKAEIATMDFQTAASTAAAPPRAPVRDDEWVHPRARPQPQPRRGRGMVIWGSILAGVGYSLAIAGTFSDSTADDGTAMLLAIPIAGPFLYAGTGAERGEAGVWVVDGLLQAGGVVLLYIGIRRLQETPDRPESPRRARRAPVVGLSFGPHGGFAQATWTL